MLAGAEGLGLGGSHHLHHLEPGTNETEITFFKRMISLLNGQTYCFQRIASTMKRFKLLFSVKQNVAKAQTFLISLNLRKKMIRLHAGYTNVVLKLHSNGFLKVNIK